MPAKSRRNANTSNHRNDTGLIQPDRKITRQRSTQQLNGCATGNALADQPVEQDHAVEMNGVEAVEEDELETDKTVIGSYGRLDELAMLLLLMQLPSFLQVMVQLAFACLTLDTTAWNVFLWPSINLLKTPGGNPSFHVSIIADGIALIFWAFAPGMKESILDMAPAVIAFCLGGGAIAKDSWTHVGLCTGTVLFGRALYDKNRRQNLANMLWSIFSKLSLSTDMLPATNDVFPAATRSWARILLELHIIAHGVIRIGRKIFEPQRPVERDQEDKDKQKPSSGKKRRRQGHYARGQQPFWAAVGHAVINVSREVDASRLERDRAEAGARNLDNLGDASMRCFEDRVWVTALDDTELSLTAVIQSESDVGSEYLSVVVNGAFWTFVEWVKETQNGRCCLHGRIFALIPSMSYTVEVHRTADGVSIFDTEFRTRPTTLHGQVEAEQRPTSPVTTLTAAIAVTKVALAELKNKSVKTKRHHQTVLKNLEKENADIERFLHSHGQDKTQVNRQQQYVIKNKLLEQANAELQEMLDAFDDSYEHEQYEKSGQRHADAKARAELLQKEVDDAERDAAKELEHTTTECEKIDGRRQKAEQRLSTLEAKRLALLQEVEERRRALESATASHTSTIAGLQKQESELLAKIHAQNNSRSECEDRIAEIDSEMQRYHSSPTTPHSPDSLLRRFGQSPGLQQSSRAFRTRSSSVISENERHEVSYEEANGIPRNTSASSGRGSSGRASQRDPSSPAPRIAPIGAEVGRGSPRPQLSRW